MDTTPLALLAVMAAAVTVACIVFVARAMHREALERKAEQ